MPAPHEVVPANRLQRAGLPSGKGGLPGGRRAMFYDEWLWSTGLEGAGRESPGPQAIHVYNALVPRMAGQQVRPSGGMSSGPTQRDVAMQRAAENRQRQAALQDGRLQHQREMEQLQLTTGTQYDIASGNAAADLYRQEMVGNQQFNQLREQGAINQVLSREEQAARMRLQELAGRQDMAAVRERGQIEQAIQEMRGRQAMAERESMNQNALQLDDRATQRAFTLDELGSQRAYNLQDMGTAAAMGLQRLSDQGAMDRLTTSGQQSLEQLGVQGGQAIDQLRMRGGQEMDQLGLRGQQANRLQKLQGRQGIEQQTIQGRQQREQQKEVGQSYQNMQQLRGDQEKEQAHQLEMYKREQQGFTRDPLAQQELDKIESEISTVVRYYKENRIKPEYYQAEMARLQESRRAVEMPNKRPTRHKTEDQIEERTGGGFFIKDPNTGAVTQYIPPDRQPAGSTGPDWMTQRRLLQQDKREEQGRKYLIENVQAYRARIGQFDSDGVPFDPTAEEQDAFIQALKADVAEFINPPPPPQRYGNEMMNNLMPQPGGQVGPQSGYGQMQTSHLSEMLPSQLNFGRQSAAPPMSPVEVNQVMMERIGDDPADQEFWGALEEAKGRLPSQRPVIEAWQEAVARFGADGPPPGTPEAGKFGLLTLKLQNMGLVPEETQHWADDMVNWWNTDTKKRSKGPKRPAPAPARPPRYGGDNEYYRDGGDGEYDRDGGDNKYYRDR